MTPYRHRPRSVKPAPPLFDAGAIRPLADGIRPLAQRSSPMNGILLSSASFVTV